MLLLARHLNPGDIFKGLDTPYILFYFDKFYINVMIPIILKHYNYFFLIAEELCSCANYLPLKYVQGYCS